MAQAAAKKANGNAEPNKKTPAAKTPAQLKALEDAKKRLEEVQKKYAEKRKEIMAAKRLTNTADKKIDTLRKKAEQELEKPNRAVELLIEKADKMEEELKKMEAEEKEVLDAAKEKEEEIKKAEEEFEKAKEEATQKLNDLGIKPTTVKRGPATIGTAAERRAKNNFQYRLKSNDWNMIKNTSNRIMSAEKYGLTVTFEDEEYVVTGGTLKEPFKHPYGQNSLTALSQVVKDHGEGVEEEEKK